LLSAEGLPPLEDFTYDLEGSAGWVGKGGTAKEQTVKQLPVSQSIAGVSMRFATRFDFRVRFPLPVSLTKPIIPDYQSFL